MIIVSGNGILIPILAIAGGFLGYYLGSRMEPAGNMPYVAMAWGAALAVLLYALTIGRTRTRVLIDPETRGNVSIKTRHTMFFLPAIFWAFALVICAAVMTLTMVSAPGPAIEGEGEVAAAAAAAEQSQPATPSPDPPAPAAAAVSPSTAPPGPAPPPPPALVAAPGDSLAPPILDLKRLGNLLTLSGRLRSEYQLRDIELALQLDGLSLDNQIAADPKVEGADWGNRISALLPELAMSVPDLHFRVADGVITITGTVKDSKVIDRLHRAITYTMESPAINSFKNELKTQ